MSRIQTQSGRMIDPFDPSGGSIGIDDISHALANLCRFTGHTSRFYSVAQHSVLVSRLVPARFAMAGLMHDAAEAYFNDLAKPVKEMPAMRAYREAEASLMGKILHLFTGDHVLPECVKAADEAMLHLEGFELMRAPWADRALAAPAQRFAPLRCLAPEEARHDFRARFAEVLTDRRNGGHDGT